MKDQFARQNQSTFAMALNLSQADLGKVNSVVSRLYAES
jgi:hypothetical protein